MNKNILKSLNEQINAEFFSAYIYLSMAAYAYSLNLPGVANWFKVQAQEEVDHAMGFFRFVNDRGEKVELEAIEKPPKAYKSILSAFEEGLKHEKYISERINRLYQLAVREKDYPLQSFLKWYIDEQVEEEASFTDLIAKAKRLVGSSEGLYLLDQELAKRKYTPVSPY